MVGRDECRLGGGMHGVWNEMAVRANCGWETETGNG